MTGSESLARAQKVRIGIPVRRPTSWWLEILKRRAERSRFRLKLVYQVVFHSLVAMSYGSRKVAKEFDRIPFRELTTGYVENLGRLFAQEDDLDFRPPRHILRAFDVTAL